MSIFAVIPDQPNSRIAEKAQQAGLPHFFLPQGQIMVSFPGTSQQLSDLLGISDGISGNGIVLAVGSYYGRTTPNTWEWLNAYWGTK